MYCGRLSNIWIDAISLNLYMEKQNMTAGKK